jgi:hypothetical protein
MHSSSGIRISYSGGCHRNGGSPDIVFNLMVPGSDPMKGIIIELILVFVK